MAHINLLPWREGLRKQKQRDFNITIAGAALLMGLVVLYAHIHINGMIEAQESRNTILKEEIAKVDRRIEEIKELEKNKQQLIARMRIIERLQQNRPEIVRRFDGLVRIVPDGLYIDSLVQKGGQIAIGGVAQSNARVSSFMRRLDASTLFERPALEYIQAPANRRVEGRVFKLVVNYVTTTKK